MVADTADWDEQLYVAAFNALSASRQVFAVDPERAAFQLNEAFKALQGTCVSGVSDVDTPDDLDAEGTYSSSTSEDEEEMYSNLEVPDTKTTRYQSTRPSCAGLPTTQSLSDPVTLYTNPAVCGVAIGVGGNQRRDHHPSFINEVEFEEVPTDQRVWLPETAPRSSLCVRETPLSVEKLDRATSTGMECSTLYHNPDLVPPPLLEHTDNSRLFPHPYPNNFKDVVGVAREAGGSRSVNEPFDTVEFGALDSSHGILVSGATRSPFEVPAWVIEGLQTSEPPTPQCLSFLTAYCWAGYHSILANSHTRSKQRWLHCAKQLQQRNVASTADSSTEPNDTSRQPTV